MRVLLIANYLPDGQISMRKFSQMLFEGLSTKGLQVDLIRPKSILCYSKKSYTGIGKWLGYIDKFLLFPLFLNRKIHGADIIHICDHSQSIYLTQMKKKPSILTCHDLLAVRSALGEFAAHQTKRLGRIFQKKILSSINHARHVVCDSQATLNDVKRLTKIQDKDLSIVYPGLNYEYLAMGQEEAKAILREHHIHVPESFFIHVGKGTWYKNLKGLGEIFRRLIGMPSTSEHHLVLVGEAFNNLKISEPSMEKEIKERVHCFFRIENKILNALYSLAEALIYPSHAEGLGWPVLEAQASGCPVFASNRAPMTEVGGDAAVFFNPDDAEEASEMIAKNISNRDKMIQKGFQNCKRFSSENMIQQYLEVYYRLLNENVH